MPARHRPGDGPVVSLASGGLQRLTRHGDARMVLYMTQSSGETFLRHTDIRVGDWIGGTVCGSDRHGPVRAIDLDRGILNYQDGTPVTVSPTGTWVVGDYRPAVTQ